MQPQDAGSGEWGNLLSGILGALFGGGGIFGLLRWIYRAGGRQPELKAELEKSIQESEQRVEAKIDAAEKRNEDRVEQLVNQFHESFSALRQKINDVELGSARDFIDRIDKFRFEMRADMRADMESLKRDIMELLRKQ